MAFGLLWGAWGAVLPAVQASSGSTDGELGMALLMIGLGALLSMRLTGGLVDRFGARVLPVVMVVFAAVGVLPAFAGSPVALGVALFLLGAASGATDVAINAAGVRAEIRSQRPVMNLAHAWFSVCVVVASLSTAALRAAGAGPRPVLVSVSILIAVITVVVLAPGALRVREQSGEGDTCSVPELRTPRPGRTTWRPATQLIVFGCLGALAYLVENAWQSWGAVYMEATLDASAGLSSTAPAVFASAAAAGRFAGNALASRCDPVRLLSAGALIAGAGTVVAAAAGTPWIGLVGIAVAGLGTSVCAPTVISLAGQWAGPDRRGAAVSTVTTIAYLGFLVGPAAVGLASSITSLSTALAGVAAVAVLLAALARLTPPIGDPASRVQAAGVDDHRSHRLPRHGDISGSTPPR